MIQLVEKGVIQVDPIVIPPRCYAEGRRQDCFSCRLHHDKGCGSPVSWCSCEYPRHKRGCPNYGRKDDCSPNMPLFFEVFDKSYPVFAVYTCFDLKEHIEKRKHCIQIGVNANAGACFTGRPGPEDHKKNMQRVYFRVLCLIIKGIG